MIEVQAKLMNGYMLNGSNLIVCMSSQVPKSA